VARLLFERGEIVLCAFVSPYAADRDRLRAMLPAQRFLEIFVDCPVEECAKRDVKGLYARAAAGDVQRLTGVSDPYEPPVHPEAVVRTDQQTVEQIVDVLVETLVRTGILPSGPATSNLSSSS
jgi:bifunctional enzyme CysN/CysC